MSTTFRCAIYTRKSSDEGLEQEFNSLDAQREACEAFIISQKHEGWKALPAHYDDGGFSGGNMDRPALKQLLADIEARKINTVVVYKVDRLSRSLADFAKIIEVFDRQGVSFVSVTQQFNTTTSMGRLTLNVLLSFAQFEREVTGERIRDKIAASKAKGMWMGGCIPMGYDAIDRKLLINPKQAKTIRHIFERYLVLKNIFHLRDELYEQGIRTPLKITKTGRTMGGQKISHGHVRNILTNPLYAGKIRHKKKVYDGDHKAIIQPDIWEAVQTQIAANRQGARDRKNVKNPCLFFGKAFDPDGKRLTTGGGKKRVKYYRYYETPPEFRSGADKARHRIRLPAGDVDRAVCNRLAILLNNEKELFSIFGLSSPNTTLRHKAIRQARKLAAHISSKSTMELMETVPQLISSVTIGEDRLEFSLDRKAILAALEIDEHEDAYEERATLKCECVIRRYNLEKRIIMPGETALARPETVETLKKALVRAHIWKEQLFTGTDTDIRTIARLNGVTDRYAALIIDLAFLPPKMVEDILRGNIPPDANLQGLIGKTPVLWTCPSTSA